MSDYSASIAVQIKALPRQVAAAVELIDNGNTVPFISRYRKEATGGLDEEQIRTIEQSLRRLRELDQRRETILGSIQEQGKLTPELEAQIRAVETRTALEDLYQPYKPKRRTRASIAREKGLEGLADLILQQVHENQSAEKIASRFVNDAVPSVDAALEGARDIVAETISDNPEVRRKTRDKALQWGLIRSEKIDAADDPRQVYALYYQYECRVDLLRPHQVLALNRGEAEKALRIRLDIAERDWQAAVASEFRVDRRSPLADQLILAITDGAERLLLPAIERDIRSLLTEKAEARAIAVFADNLRALLSQPPITGHVVLGIDPGFRTGCKVAVVDATGKVLATETIYPHEPQQQRQAALAALKQLVHRFGVSILSIGNGTASRETEQLAVELIREEPGVRYLITSEAGASVYSASPLARAELTGMDVSLRGAVSIARRVQDPLAELVKIDPKSIGIGLYQHDVNQKQLDETLQGVVESVVNRVGVDVNTASPALLTYVSGIGPKLAEAIVAYRNEKGGFRSRTEFKKVSGLGPRAFQQAAGFLRILGGDQPLDSSAIHPESYPAAEALLQKGKIALASALEDRQRLLDHLLERTSLPALAEELNVGEPTLVDICEQLVRPGRDPRQDLPAPILRSDVLSMEDLNPGMTLQGTVRNVVDFGAFIDIGVKQDGLLHRSQVPSGTYLKVGDVLTVKILRIDIDRGRIGLGWVEKGN